MNDERVSRELEIETRALAYAVRAVRLVQHLESRRDYASQVIGRQLLRSSVSIGANLSEARSAETRRDFVHKCTLSLKECRESLYWLRLLVAADLVTEKRLAAFTGETNELIAILTTIVKRTRRSIK